MQEIYTGIDYGFEWTDDGWYKWDMVAGQKAALAARNARAKELRAQGYQVRLFSLGDQLISKGGINTGRPDIQLWTKAYGLNAR